MQNQRSKTMQNQTEQADGVARQVLCHTHFSGEQGPKIKPPGADKYVYPSVFKIDVITKLSGGIVVKTVEKVAEDWRNYSQAACTYREDSVLSYLLARSAGNGGVSQRAETFSIEAIKAAAAKMPYPLACIIVNHNILPVDMPDAKIAPTQVGNVGNLMLEGKKIPVWRLPNVEPETTDGDDLPSLPRTPPIENYTTGDYIAVCPEPQYFGCLGFGDEHHAASGPHDCESSFERTMVLF